EARAIAREQRRRRLWQHQLDASFLEPRLQLRAKLRQHFPRIHPLGALAGLSHSRELEHVVHETLDRAAGLLDAIDEVAPGLPDRRTVLLAQQPREAEQRDEWRTKIVRERRDAVLELVVGAPELCLDALSLPSTSDAEHRRDAVVLRSGARRHGHGQPLPV